MTSEMLIADKYLRIINERMVAMTALNFVEVSGKLSESKGSRWVWGEAIEDTGYAVRWSPTPPPFGQ